MSASNILSAFPVFSPSEKEIYHILGDWIALCVGSRFTVFQGQQNRSPPPRGGFITMIIRNQERLSTNGRTYHSDQSVTISQSLMLTIQITCIGQEAGEAASILKTLWRDMSCCAFFAKHLPSCAPVSSDDPVQDPLITSEKQYENRWRLDLRLNALSKLTLKQETADDIRLKTIFT